MRKRTKWLAVLLIAVFMVAGCGKKSGLEGKVVDRKGQPISGLKVIAKQVPPIIKGYEQFDAKTGSDGIFRLKGLYPLSVYVISVWHEEWSTNVNAIANSGPEGETIMLKEPIQVAMAVNAQGMPMDPQTNKPRLGFVVSDDGGITDSETGLKWLVMSDDGVITDFKTSLEWFAGPDRDTTWAEAQAWCAGLTVAGGAWRMPQRAELETLYIKDLGERNMAPAFKTTGSWVWSGEQYDTSSAWVFDFDGGEMAWLSRDDSKFTRAFAVRSRK